MSEVDLLSEYLSAHDYEVSRTDDSLVVHITGAEPSNPVDGKTVPCPTCDLPADLKPPAEWDCMYHAVCVNGHDNTLAPSVLAYLLTWQ